MSTLRFEAFPITTTPHLKAAEGCDLMAHRGEATYLTIVDVFGFKNHY